MHSPRLPLLALTLAVALRALAAPGTPARVEIGLAQTAAANPPLGANEFGDPGGTQFSAGNLIPDSGFEPLSMRRRVRVSRTGTENGYPWFEFDESGGITGWDLTTTGLYNGASVRIYRIVDAAGHPLPQGSDNYLDLTAAAAYTRVGSTTIPEAGAANLPLGGWVDTAYAMPSSVYGTRASLSYTDARWVENGKTYYYIVTAIGSNSSDDGGTNESDPAATLELTATPQAGLLSSPHIYITGGNGLNEIGNVASGNWYGFQPRVAGASGTVTWALLDAANNPIAPPAGLTFNSATGELGGQATSTPPATLLRFRATAANGTATRDFILNNPAWTPTGGTTRPLPPTNITATAGDGYVHLSWTASASAGVVGYRVYRAELPRAQQRQRVYLAPGAPALVKDDYVHLEKRILSADPRWAHPRVRSGTIGETWRTSSANTTLRRVAHPGTIPADFRFPGDSCLQVTTAGTGTDEISGPAIFFPAIAHGEAGWYSQLEPGRTYRYEAWLRQSGLANSGQVTLTISGAYSAIAQTFAVDSTWRLCSFEFTAPPRPTTSWHMWPVVRFTGPGQLWIDNIRLFRADTPADRTATLAPPSPLVYDELMASQPLTGEKGMLRSMYVLLNKATMASCLGLNRDAGLTMNWYQSAEGASNMTVPYFLQYAYRSGTSPSSRLKPWLNLSSNMREDEWLALVEYLGATIDPANPADVAAKPWAYLRYRQRGVTTPWTDEFPRIYLEFANETWHNGAVSDEWFGWGRSGWVHGGAQEFGLAAHYLTSYVRSHSPYFNTLDTAGKLRFVLGSNYQNYGENAAAGAPYAHAIGHTTYVGPKWEVDETPLATYDDHGIQATLLGHIADTASAFTNYRRWREQLAAAGHTMDLLAYEGGPSGYSLPGQDTPTQHDYSELYGKSLAMGVAALDAWLAAYEAGFSDQAYLGMGVGDYWSSHTQIADGYRPHAGWLALTLRNRFATGRMIRSAVVESPTIRWDDTEHPLISSYAFRDGSRLCVFLLSRKLGGVHDGVDFGDGATPVTLVLPATPTGPATLYHLSGDPRATNITAMNVTIQQTTATLDRETTVALPPGSIYLYVVDTDLPDRDDPLQPPSASPSITYSATGATLTWPAVAGATGYTVFRSTKPYFDRQDVTETFTSAANSFTDTGAVGGTTYYYRVATTNGWGSGFWNLVAAGGVNPSTPILPAPALDGLLETTGALVANWHEVAGASGYRVGLATKSGGPYTWTDAGIATSWTFAGLENGRTYYAVVYAYGAAGRGPDSAERAGTTLVPGQTAVLAAWEGQGALVYSTNLGNPPQSLPVGRHLLALGASDLVRGAGGRLDTNNYGFSNTHYDGKFPFEPTTDSGNFGAAGGGSLANVVARDLYVGCTVAPAAGQSVSISSVDTGFQYSFGSRDEPIRRLQAVLRYRVGTGAWHDVAAPVDYGVEAGYWIYNDLTLALAGEAALQNVTQPVELRFYLYWTGDDARWHPAALVRSAGEDLIVRGTAATVAAPGQPVGLRTAAGRKQVAISWTPVAGATSYTLRWGATAGTYTGSLGGLTQASATITGLAAGTPLYFTVEAVNAFGAGPAAAPVAATPLTSFQSWQSVHFTSAQLAAGLGAMASDPDADGQSNLVEYAFGTAPLAAGAPVWQVTLGGTPARLSATLPLWTANDDITVTLEASSDLATWTPLARSTAGAPMLVLVDGVLVTESSADPVLLTVRDLAASTETTRRFLRLSVTAP